MTHRPYPPPNPRRLWRHCSPQPLFPLLHRVRRYKRSTILSLCRPIRPFPVRIFTTSRLSTHVLTLLGTGPQKHLLDDDEAATPAPPLQDKSAEIGNMKNQLASTNRSLETTQSERTSVEQTLSSQASQLSALLTQLSSAKAAYETETKLLATLRERWTNQNVEILKAREELIRAESDLSAVRVEKAEMEGSFLRDKEEARALHRKMFEVTQQAEVLKADVEKLKKEAKQQKGLLAIARKQLNVKEAEHAKVLKELEDAKAENQAIVGEREAAEAELEKLSSAPPIPKASEIPASTSADTLAKAAAQPLPGTPVPSSPASVSTTLAKSNNPFERLAMASGKSTPVLQTPFLPLENASAPTPPPVAGPPESEADAGASGDPFGFEEAFIVEKPVTTGQKVQRTGSTSTPKPAPASILPSTATEVPPLSPTDASDNEYATPPTTSGGFTSPAEAEAAFPDISKAVSHFPALPVDGSAADLFNPEISKPRADNEPSISARGMELHPEESDSDSDEDDVPLGKRNGAGGQTSNVKRTTGDAEKLPGPSFDDIFAQPLAPAQNGAPPTAVTTIASSPPLNQTVTNDTSPKPATPAQAPVPVAAPTSTLGVNAFDEAMFNIPGNGAAPKLTFDSAFDTGFEDNFDFGAIAPVSFPPPPTAVDVKPPNTSTISPSPKQERFDDIFRIPPANDVVPPTLPMLDVSAPLSIFTPNGVTQSPIVQSAAAPAAAPAAPSSPAYRVSFEEPKPNPQPPKPSEPDAQLSVPPSTGSQPASPENNPGASQMNSNRPVSPPAQPRSSPPRVSSPKARASTSPSKEPPHEKPKDPPQKHSKLSVSERPAVLSSRLVIDAN